MYHHKFILELVSPLSRWDEELLEKIFERDINTTNDGQIINHVILTPIDAKIDLSNHPEVAELYK